MDAPVPPVPPLAALFEHLPDAVYLLDPETSNILWGNHLAWESLGLSRDEVLNHSVLSLQKDVTGAPQWSEIAAVIRSAPCFTFVGRHRHAQGHEVTVEVNTSHFFDGGREYFLSVARDISRRVALEADLKTRENQLWFALNEALDGLWDWDVLTSEVFFSPQLKRMLGYGPDEMPPRLDSWSANIHPDDAARVREALTEHLEGKRQRYEARYRLRNRNGNYLWVLDRGRVSERDAQGAATRVVGMVQDITEQHLAQAALQRSESEQRTLIASLPDVIMRLDREGRHTFVSENISTLAPMTAAQVVGRTHRELGFPLHLCEFWDGVIEAVFTTGQAHESEFQMEGAQGLQTISWRVVPDRDAAIGVRSVLAVCRNITERKRAEAELARHRHHLEELVAERTAALSEAKASAEAANRAKSNFLAHMSHELRTPMSAVIGMTGLALQRAEDPVLRDQLGKAVQASQHLLNLINDILDLSKIEAERMKLEDSEFELGQVLDSVVHLVGHRVADKGLQLVIEPAPGLARRVFAGDALRLKQILLNLTDNALKFTPHGKVHVGVRCLEALDDGLQLRFEVTDSGIGIGDEARRRLFMPFEQAEHSTTRRFGGTGLGLAICRQLVQMMGGQIGVDSVLGQGSTFWFTVTLREVTPLPASPLRGPGDARDALRQRHAGARVLVVEDDPVSREVSSLLLQQAGLSVQVAGDGEEARAMACHEPFALILMDMQMPRLNGVEATRAIRAESLNRETPILALTANAFDEDRQLCLHAGMNGHLTKPIDAARLFEAALLHLRPATPQGAAPVV
jgi:PAS domain S-box-containing protein